MNVEEKLEKIEAWKSRILVNDRNKWKMILLEDGLEARRTFKKILKGMKELDKRKKR